MRTAKVIQMRCIAQPSASMRRNLAVMYPELGMPVSGSVMGSLDDLVKVDALGDVLTKAIEACSVPGGAMDERNVAHYVLRHMAGSVFGINAMSGRSPLQDIASDSKVVVVFGRLITRAIAETQSKDGLTHMQSVAVYILRAMKEVKGS